MTGLIVRGITKSFGSQQVLLGVDLEVEAGSVTAALGPSGGGKTTLLRIIAGFLDADEGSVSFGGRTLVDGGRGMSPQRRGVGYVPQEGALFPHLDVAANIAFGIRGADRRSFDAGELMELVGLEPRLGSRYPHELSGGQQQRAALARALAPRPGLVLLDEPFSSLDAGLRVETGTAVVRALRAAGATAVLVTHDQDEALALADHVAVIRDGRVAQIATPDQLYRAPVDPSVAAFVGTAIILAAEVSGESASCALGAVAVEPGGPQGTCRLMVRPEQVVLGAPGGGATARVDEVRFFGHDAMVRLTLTADASRIEARTSGTALPVVGEVVGVAIRGPVAVFEGDQQP